MTESTDKDSALDEHDIIGQRREQLAKLKAAGIAFPNDYRRDTRALDLHNNLGELAKDELEAHEGQYKLAGRIMLRRVMGKASFITIQDMSGRIQAYVRKNALPEGVYQEFKTWDIGDIVGVEGSVFRTGTGELTIFATNIRLLTKSLRPLPDKYHGLADREQRYRRRYLDLMVNDESRRIFQMRSKIIAAVRNFLLEQDFLEVETPMMQAIPGGATAKPFETYHNALDQKMYLRVAPELYLKRLVVGGLERVFEINRNFRNEGLSTRHNPEFTMLEFYQAYADYQDMMTLTERLWQYLSVHVVGQNELVYQGKSYDLTKPIKRQTVLDAIYEFNSGLTAEDLASREAAQQVATKLGIQVEAGWGLGKIQLEIFEKTAEPNLLEPTFITHYPAEVSPLARPNDDNPFVTDRFEFFMAGREIANGFSELNDPEEQAARFKQQVAAKEAGDDEAMFYDNDYITALEYGMPPTAGEGIGIDRLVMLLTDVTSIRDVLLFPHMRSQTDKE